MQKITFSDFDAFAGSVRDVDSTMTLQNPTHHSWVLSHVQLPMIHVQLGKMGSGNIVEGQSWPNGFLLYLPLTDDCGYWANGTLISKGSFLILEPGCEFCVSTRFEHDWCSIYVPTQKLVHGESAEPSLSSEKPICRVTRPDRQLADRFRVLVGQIMTSAAQHSQFNSSPAAVFAEAKFVKVASSIVGETQPGEPKHYGRPRLPRQEIILRAKELLEERATKPVNVGELVAATGVSERTLRTAFNEYFGLGPVRYLQLRRLHQVNRALRTADPEAVSVSDVLVQHGVWEFGRFASRYRRLFGELPSETLRLTRR